jgi:hypothetical protein
VHFDLERRSKCDKSGVLCNWSGWFTPCKKEADDFYNFMLRIVSFLSVTLNTTLTDKKHRKAEHFESVLLNDVSWKARGLVPHLKVT